MKNLFFFLTVLLFSLGNNKAIAQTELLHNTNFETPGSYWTTTGNFYYNNYFSSYHSATSYTFLSSCPTCGTAINNAIGDLSQTMSVPSGATAMTLSFWTYITTSETTTTTAYDVLHVSISNGPTTDYVDLSNLDATSGYVLRSFTVPDYALFAGGTVTLKFHGTTDFSNPTQFRIDDASLMATVPCTYSLSSSSFTCPSSSASTYTGVAAVTAPSGCSWAASVTSGSSWLSTSSSGVGSGSISINVTANTSTSPRTGTISVAGSTLSITQPGISCTYSLSSSSYSCPSSGASTYTAIVGVTAPSGCSWMANVTSGSSWLSTSSSGSGSGSISITVSANTSTSPRIGTIDVSGNTLTITQPGISCTYSLSSSSYTCPSSGASTYTSIVSVIAPSGCSWIANVTSGSSWLSTSSSGSGSGSISITVSANTSTSPRIGTIDVSGNTLTITQPGIGCTYSLSSGSYACPSSGASTYSSIVSVVAPSGCSWMANVTSGSSWLSTSSSGSGSGSISITVSANTSTSPRIGTIDVSGNTLTITQPGIGCTYSLSSGSYACPSSGASTYSSIVSVVAPSGCSWMANVTSGSSWLSTSSSGSGSGSISITVIANTSTSARTGIIDVSGNTLTITQPGSIITPAITITSPNGGENWLAGSNHTITGTSSSSITTVQLDYTTDNGLTFFPINTITPIGGTFNYSWTIPATPSTNCKVRATGYGSGTVTDLSNAIFTISIGCFALGDDYPYSYHSDCNSVFVPDAWNLYIGQCTSWTSWKINQAAGYSSLTGYHPFTNNNVFGNSVHLGNAVNWKDALSPYYPVNNTPAPGAIGWYRDHTSDPDGGGGIGGHVVFINCVTGNLVTLTEYNFVPCQYNTRIVDISQPFQGGNRKPDSYIHIEAGGYGSVSGINPMSSNENEFTVYPNPATKNININTLQAGSVCIYNIQGQKIAENNISKGENNIDLNSLSPGMYICKYISVEGKQIITKLIKQ